ncbi:hypothetical protein ACP70R_037208 [Stipagrostis hirtigluma subsp. patula]
MRLASSALLRRAATMSSSSYGRRGHQRPHRSYSARPSPPPYEAAPELVSGDYHHRAVRAANDSLRRGGGRGPPPPYMQHGPRQPPHRQQTPHQPPYGQQGPHQPPYGQQGHYQAQYGYGYGQPQQPFPVYGRVPYDYGHPQPQPLPLPQYGYGVPNPYGHGHLQLHWRSPAGAGFRPAALPVTPRAERFKVLSYNILADYLAQEHQFLYERIPQFILHWNWRKDKLVYEFGLWSPDILCLQEVDKFTDLEQVLASQGYNGIWKMRTGNAADGCAIFWRTARFQLRYEENIEFNKLGLRDNVAQLCVLESVAPRKVQTNSSPSHPQQAKQVVVCNIHVLYNPKRGDIKLGQVRTLLDRAYAVSKMWNDAPVILCGDFNSTPKSPLYNFLLEQKLDLSGLVKSMISGQLTSDRSQGLYYGSNVSRSHPPFYPSNSRGGNMPLQSNHQPQTEIVTVGRGQVLSGTSESRFDTESRKSCGNKIPCSGSGSNLEEQWSCLEGPGKDGCTSDANAHSNQTEGEEGSVIEKSSERCFGGINTESGEGPDVTDVPSAPDTVCGEIIQSANEIVHSSHLPSSDDSTGLKNSIELIEGSKKVSNSHRDLPGDVISEEFTCAFDENGVQSDELLAVSKDNPVEKEKAIGSMLSGQENCKTSEPQLSHFNVSQNFTEALHQMSKVSLEGESSSGEIHLTSPAEPVNQPNGAVSDSCDNQCTPEVINKLSVLCKDGSDNAHANEDGTTANEVLCTDLNSDPSFFEELTGGNDRLLEGEEQLPETKDGSPSSRQVFTSNGRYDPYRWAPEEIKAATGKDDCTSVEHNLKLRSVYTDVEDFEGTKDANKEPLVTSYNRKFMGTVDYIWASEDLQTVQVLDTFPKEILNQTIGFPTKKWGSDHIALVCELAFTK